MATVDSQLGLGQQPTLVQSQSGLRADGIGKSFNKRRVVRNVSIKLNRGEAVGLLGGQCWYSGSDEQQFHDLMGKAQFVSVRPTSRSDQTPEFEVK